PKQVLASGRNLVCRPGTFVCTQGACICSPRVSILMIDRYCTLGLDGGARAVANRIGLVRLTNHTAEPAIIIYAVDVPFPPSPHPIAGAIRIGAEEGPSPLYPLGLVIAGAVAGVRALRIPCDRNSGEFKLVIVIRPVPIAAPLPDVASHIVKS